MGFGLLLIGYLTVHLMTMNPLGALIRVAGYGLITYASLKLKKYHRSFSYLTIMSLVMLSIALVLLCADGIRYLYDLMLIDSLWIGDSHKMIVGYVDQGSSFFFQSAMVYGVYCIAKETEIRKISNNAIRNFIFLCFYYFAYAISFLPFQGIQNTQLELKVIVWVSYFACILLNFLLLFSCYAKICDEDDEKMSRAPSKLSFMNRLWAEFDKREERAMRESAEYRKEKQKKRRK